MTPALHRPYSQTMATLYHKLRKTFVGTVASLLLMSCAISPAAASSRTAGGKPNLNGIWQVLNEANWNLEPHVAAPGAIDTLGAIGAVAPGMGVVEGGKI